MSGARVTLLVGSPRERGTSTSEALGRHLLRGLERGGAASEVVFLAAHRGERVERDVAPAVAASGVVVLASPLYVDALPAPVTAALERLAACRARWEGHDPPRLAAIVNCGFPEAFQAHLALEICHAFADAAGLAWAGGLAVGGGEALHGTALDRAGGKAARLRRALDLAAEALIAGRAVPEEAVSLAAAPIVPARLYTLLGNLGWLREARRNGALRRLWDRPYES